MTARQAQRRQLLAHARALPLGPLWLVDVLALVVALAGAAILLVALAGVPWVAWWR